MGRYYRLSKSITEETAGEILREILEIEDVESAEFTEENTKILVKTEKDKYPEVMTRNVNCPLQDSHIDPGRKRQ